MPYRVSAGAVHELQYHVVWCPKYRRPVLMGKIKERLEQLVKEKVTAMKGEIQALVVQPDHVHLFLAVPPLYAPHQIAQSIKRYTSHVLRQEFSTLRSRLPSLWSRSYYIGSAGHVSSKTIEKYIAAQKGK